LTLPLATGLGQSNTPGTVAGFGPVDGPLARDLLSAAAAHPATRFCITLTGLSGQAIGHGCLRGPGAWPKLTAQSPTQLITPTQPQPLTLTIAPLAQDTCDHRHHEPGYQPSRQLQHLIEARSTTCSAPGCQRAASRCDLDHTIPHDQGGLTCECNLAPLCRHHHRAKQSSGWVLSQSSPGVLRWTTPGGRHYLTAPDADP
jgi:hypothetical protein